MQTNATIETNKATVERFFAGTHTGQLDVIDETVSERIVTHGFPGGVNPHNRESYKQFFRDFGRAFSDMRFQVLSLVADERYVAVRFEINVRHSGEFAGIAPTGWPVGFTGQVLYRMENGKIAETWLQADELAILAQLGALPAQAA